MAVQGDDRLTGGMERVDLDERKIEIVAAQDVEDLLPVAIGTHAGDQGHRITEALQVTGKVEGCAAKTPGVGGGKDIEK